MIIDRNAAPKHIIPNALIKPAKDDLVSINVIFLKILLFGEINSLCKIHNGSKTRINIIK